MTSLSYLIIPHYFTRWRGVANACVVAGIGIGQMIGPILVEFLQKEYGYVGGTLLMGAVLFHACIGASLLRPIQNQTITNTSVQLVEPESRTSGVVTAEKKWTTVAIRIFLCVCRNIVTNFSVLKSRRAVIIAIGGLLTFNSWLNFIALIPFAVQAAGHPLQAASTCVIVSAVCNLVTCLAVSMLSDWSKFSMKGACMTSTAVIAASTFAFSVVTDIWWQKIIMGMWGCGVGSYMGIYGLTIAYYMGVHSLDATLGVTQLLIGLGFITIGPIIGVIRDASDSYTFSIWVLAGLAACSFILWIFMPNTTQHSHTTPLSPIT
ncbi:monocarboxylate transporter 6-like [Homarus americanus]|nr:monocarboxylate transporter 6-like [Homarus americanus]